MRYKPTSAEKCGRNTIPISDLRGGPQRYEGNVEAGSPPQPFVREDALPQRLAGFTQWDSCELDAFSALFVESGAQPVPILCNFMQLRREECETAAAVEILVSAENIENLWTNCS